MVPRVDLSATTERKIIDQVGGACEYVGFVRLAGHGVPKALLHRFYAVLAELFSYPDSVLTRYERADIGRQVGFAHFGQEGAKDRAIGDLKRYWHTRRPHPPSEPYNIWPAEVPGFKHVATELFQSLDTLSIDLAHVLDAYLGYEPGTLAGQIHGGNSLLRSLHYPALDGSEPPDAVRSGEHEDINEFTLLIAGTASGLEVQTRDGQWVSVGEEEDEIVMNIGDMGQMRTKGRLKSTRHRVVNRPGERYSAPFFVHPRSEVVLDEATGFTAGQYLAQRLAEIDKKKA